MLSVSSLAWRVEESAAAAAVLHEFGASGIEIAPTTIWGSWENVLQAGPEDLPTALSSFARPAMQSLLFNLPDHLMFGDTAAVGRLIRHLDNLFVFAERFGCRALIFGSPKQRRRGTIDRRTAYDRFAALMSEMAPLAAGRGALFCLEANPESYGCDFVCGTEELIELFEMVRQPGLGLHFDTGTAAVNKEDLATLIRRVGPALDHIHISEPKIGTFTTPAAHHSHIARALADIGYRHWISLEMLSGPDGIEDLRTALAFISRAYAPILSLA
jgi:D-psicose/D-tagatose/L-ribulose 3-epimerase